MKKIYLQPKTEIINVNIETPMLFGSDNGDGTANGGGNMGDLGEGPQLSREGRSFGDE